MVALRWIISTALAASNALASDFAPAGVFIHPILAKRQNESPGSPSYNCHDNCGKSTIPPRPNKSQKKSNSHRRASKIQARR